MLVSAPVPPPVFPMVSLISLPVGRCAQLGAASSVSGRQTTVATTKQILRIGSSNCGVGKVSLCRLVVAENEGDLAPEALGDPQRVTLHLLGRLGCEPPHIGAGN